MKDSNRYRLKIKVYTKKHKDTYKNDKTKLRIMLMGERELKECNPGGTHKTSTLFVIFFFLTKSRIHGCLPQLFFIPFHM